ncbi:MAG: cation diffusion facilitator family transporter [Alphaproteobacteria bacterium]|nr:cation diffusion facilitator family transporter [Alphaproteobacteria bacterium]
MLLKQLKASNDKLKKAAAIASVSLAFILIAIKFIGVVYTGSLSILSSLADSLADLFASAATFWAIKISSQPADNKHRYGHGKAEALSALLQTAFIAGSGIFICYDAINKFINPKPLLRSESGIIVMIICLALTILLILFQKFVAKKTNSQAIRADASHYSVDVITNISVITALFIVNRWQVYWVDSLMALLISLYLLLNAYSLAQDALSMLMDKELSDDIREKIIKTTLACDHINGVHDLRSRDLGGTYIFELHLELDGNLSLNKAHEYTVAVESAIINMYPNSQVIIHQDPSGIKESRLDHQISGSCMIDE